MTSADPTYAAPNVVTLLTAKGKRLTKKITSAGVQPADKSRQFAHDAEPVDDLEDLRGFLRWLSEQTDTCIVRPAVIEGAPAEIRRKSSGPEQQLIDVPRSWLMVDIDKDVLTFPRLWMRKPERHIRKLIRAALPSAFHGAGVIAQFSSQMDADGGTPRVHLWFWLHRPLISSEAKHWLKGSPIDRSVYNRGQPHFTAAPIFEDGVDPLGDSRIVFMPGPVVEVPDGRDTSTAEEAGGGIDTSVDISNFVNLDYGDNGWRRGISKIGDHDGGDGFHIGIRNAAINYIRRNYNPQAVDPVADLDYAAFERAVREHLAGLDLTPERRADLDDRLRDMPRCFWEAVPKVEAEIRAAGILVAAFQMPSGPRMTLLELVNRGKAASDAAR